MKVLSIPLRQTLWLALLLSSTLGCRPLSYLGLAMPPVTAIQTLSEQNQGSAIYLRGKVVGQAPFIDSGAYQIQDETGTIWVLSDRPLPKLGEAVVIKVQLQYQAIAVGGQQLGELYVIEIEQLNGVASNASPPQPLPTPATASQPIPPQPLPTPATASQLRQPQIIQPQPSQTLIPNERFLPHKRQSK